jgi:hypothetical protein
MGESLSIAVRRAVEAFGAHKYLTTWQIGWLVEVVFVPAGLRRTNSRCLVVAPKLILVRLQVFPLMLVPKLLVTRLADRRPVGAGMRTSAVLIVTSLIEAAILVGLYRPGGQPTPQKSCGRPYRGKLHESHELLVCE